MEKEKENIVEKSSDTWKFSVIEKIINEPDSELSELFDKGSENSEN